MLSTLGMGGSARCRIHTVGSARLDTCTGSLASRDTGTGG
jgi:hypothetical protein